MQMKKNIKCTLFVLSLALVIFLGGCGGKASKSIRVPLDWGLLPSLSPETFSEVSEEGSEFFARDALNYVYAETAQTPICIILQDCTAEGEKTALEKGDAGTAFYFLSPEIEGFTSNPAQAQTLLYKRFTDAKHLVADRRHVSYMLYAVSRETGSIYPMIANEKGDALFTNIQYESDSKNYDPDLSFCEWVLKVLSPSAEEKGSVSQRLAEIDSPILSAGHISDLSRKAWEILSNWDFSSRLVPTGTDFDGKFQLPEGIEAISPTLVIERYVLPDPESLDPYQYEAPDFSEWMQGAVCRYCVTSCDDLLHVPVEEPRSAIVCENLGYSYMGEYQKIGKLYSYYTRDTLIDLETEEIIAWTLQYSSNGYEKKYSINGTQHGTGSYYVVDKDYSVDANGHTMYEVPYAGTDWGSLIGAEDNYRWGGTAVVRNIRMNDQADDK